MESEQGEGLSSTMLAEVKVPGKRRLHLGPASHPRRRQRFCLSGRALPLRPAPVLYATGSSRSHPKPSPPLTTAKGLHSGDRPPLRASPALAGRMSQVPAGKSLSGPASQVIRAAMEHF